MTSILSKVTYIDSFEHKIYMLKYVTALLITCNQEQNNRDFHIKKIIQIENVLCNIINFYWNMQDEDKDFIR